MMFGVIELKGSGGGGGGLNKSDNQGTLSTGHAYTFLPPLLTTPPFLFNITPLSPPPLPIPALPATDQFLHCIATLLLQNARVSYRPVCSLSPSTLNAVRVCTIHVYIIILYYTQYIIMYNLKGISHCHGLRLQLPLATRRVARARCVGHRREDKLRTTVIIL